MQCNPLIHLSLQSSHRYLFSLQSLCLMHTGKPPGVAVSHCMAWVQTQQILTAFGLLRRGSTRCTTMHWYPLQAQIQVCLLGHTIYRVTALRPAALMQRPGCEPESLIATQRRLVAKKKQKKRLSKSSLRVRSATTLICGIICSTGCHPPPAKQFSDRQGRSLRATHTTTGTHVSEQMV